MNELFPYQKEGVAFLASHRFAYLADEMGLGKSAQSACAADVVAANKSSPVRILVVCPAVARLTWDREFRRWSFFIHKIFICKSGSDIPPKDAELVICSFDYVSNHRAKLAGKWDVVIVDEFHFVKNHEAIRAKALLGKDGVVRDATYFWALSGTPAPNSNPSEMWLFLYVFKLTPFKSDQFMKRYCVGYETPYGFKVTAVRNENLNELQKILSKILLRRRKEDVMKELPEIFYQDMTVEAGPVDLEMNESFFQYAFPHDRSKELAEKLEKEKRQIETVMEISKPKDRILAMEGLADSVSTLRRYTGLQKVKSAGALIRQELELGAYEKVVVFALHRDVIENMRMELRDFGAVTLYGKTDPAKRQKNIDNFQMNPKIRVFIGQIQAAGTNITLTAAHNVVFVEQSWVPGDNLQAAMRCHRIGQTKPVTVRFLSLANSIDEKVTETLKKKMQQFKKIFGDELRF